MDDQPITFESAEKLLVELEKTLLRMEQENALRNLLKSYQVKMVTSPMVRKIEKYINKIIAEKPELVVRRRDLSAASHTCK